MTGFHVPHLGTLSCEVSPESYSRNELQIPKVWQGMQVSSAMALPEEVFFCKLVHLSLPSVSTVLTAKAQSEKTTKDACLIFAV